MKDFEDQKRSDGLRPVAVLRHHAGAFLPADDVVAVEEPLEVRLNGGTLAYLMRLPGDDRLLAAGFCFSEGLIRERGRIETIEHRSGGGFDESDGIAAAPAAAAAADVVEVRAVLEEGARERFEAPRVVYTGRGGADPSREIDFASMRVESSQRFTPEAVLELPGRLLAEQDIFRTSGGTHGAGLFDSEGRVLVVKEDVGRHNAVDKVLGHLLLSGGVAEDKGIILSGRLSCEMVLKAARAGVPLLCSVSAPTSLGVEVGGKTGVTLVGFLRGAGFNVYTHPSRIGGD